MEMINRRIIIEYEYIFKKKAFSLKDLLLNIFNFI